MEFLKKLSCVCAPSGRESALASVIEQAVAGYCDAISYDKIGNLIVSVKPDCAAPRVMFCAHMDEVGFMVKHVDGEGRVKTSLLGKVDTATLSGRRVRFLNGAVGIVAAKPIHVLSEQERDKPTPVDKLYIELGGKNGEDGEPLVKIGDFGTFEPKFTALAGGTFAGKALGGRACVRALIALVKDAWTAKQAGTLNKECYFVFSVKREIAVRSFFAVETAAFHIKPDMAIVLDTVAVCDYLDKPTAIGAKCGDGIVLAPADMRTMYDRALFANAVALCDREKIAYQYPRSASLDGGEGGAIHKTETGIRTLSVSIPVRNLHSGAEIVKKNDLDAAEAFLRAHLLSDEG